MAETAGAGPTSAPRLLSGLARAAEGEAGGAFDPDKPASREARDVPRAVFEETLRLHLSAAAPSREAGADDEMLGRRIPAATAIAIARHVRQRRQNLWTFPEAVDPSH